MWQNLHRILCNLAQWHHRHIHNMKSVAGVLKCKRNLINKKNSNFTITLIYDPADLSHFAKSVSFGISMTTRRFAFSRIQHLSRRGWYFFHIFNKRRLDGIFHRVVVFRRKISRLIFYARKWRKKRDFPRDVRLVKMIPAPYTFQVCILQYVRFDVNMRNKYNKKNVAGRVRRDLCTLPGNKLPDEGIAPNCELPLKPIFRNVSH